MPAVWLEEGEGPACVGQGPVTCILPEFSSDNPGTEGALLDIVLVPKEAMCWGQTLHWGSSEMAPALPNLG